MKQLDSFWHFYFHIYVCLWVSCVTISSWQLLPSPTEKNPVVNVPVVKWLWAHSHISCISRYWNFVRNDFVVNHSHNSNDIPFISLIYLPLAVNHPCGRPQTSFMNLSPHWPSQHTKLGILWSGLNINLCHSHTTADPQAHSRVFCGEFETNLAKYFKPEGFYYCKPAGLWWSICSRIQIDLTEFHQGKVIQEISLFLHLCMAVLSGPLDWHWLWGITIGHGWIITFSEIQKYLLPYGYLGPMGH